MGQSSLGQIIKISVRLENGNKSLIITLDADNELVCIMRLKRVSTSRYLATAINVVVTAKFFVLMKCILCFICPIVGRQLPTIYVCIWYLYYHISVELSFIVMNTLCNQRRALKTSSSIINYAKCKKHASLNSSNLPHAHSKR